MFKCPGGQAPPWRSPSDPPMPDRACWPRASSGHRHRRRTDYGKQNRKERTARAPFTTRQHGPWCQGTTARDDLLRAGQSLQQRRIPREAHERQQAPAADTDRVPRPAPLLRDRRGSRGGHGTDARGPPRRTPRPELGQRCMENASANVVSSEAQAASPSLARRRSGETEPALRRTFRSGLRVPWPRPGVLRGLRSPHSCVHLGV